MPQYRMRIYRPGEVLWRTRIIDALDDQAAKEQAQTQFADDDAQLREQTQPKIDDPTLERFTVFDGERLICEEKAGTTANG